MVGTNMYCCKFAKHHLVMSGGSFWSGEVIWPLGSKNSYFNPVNLRLLQMRYAGKESGCWGLGFAAVQWRCVFPAITGGDSQVADVFHAPPWSLDRLYVMCPLIPP